MLNDWPGMNWKYVSPQPVCRTSRTQSAPRSPHDVERSAPWPQLARSTVRSSAGAALPEEAAGAESDAAQSASSAATLRPGKVIRTRRSWECSGRLRAYDRLPIKVISNMPNPGDGDAIRLIGCRGDGDRSTVDLILDVNGNGRGRGTAFDAVRIGMGSRGLVVTGDVECGARHTNPNIHQDIVQALSGRNIYFRRFTSGHPRTGRWTCWATCGRTRGAGPSTGRSCSGLRSACPAG